MEAAAACQRPSCHCGVPHPKPRLVANSAAGQVHQHPALLLFIAGDAYSSQGQRVPAGVAGPPLSATEGQKLRSDFRREHAR